MTTPVVRQEIAVVVAADEHKPDSGEITLDALGIPYGTGTIDVPLNTETALEDFDPRDDVRVQVTASEAVSGTTRTFDLGLRARTVDLVAKSVALEVASDEALLEDYAALTQDLGAIPLQDSLRDVVGYVLAKIGATLQPGPDFDFTTYSDATNLQIDPRMVFYGGVYMIAGANFSSDSVFPGTRPNGIGQNGFGMIGAGAGMSDSYMTSGLGLGSGGLVAGKTYVVSATASVRTVLGGAAVAGDRERRIVVFVASPTINGGAYVVTRSAGQIPNVAESGPLNPANEHRLSVEFTIPPDATSVLVRFYFGRETGGMTWTKVRATEKSPIPGVDDTEFFTGSDPDTTSYRYDWTGDPDHSTSKRTALITDRSPELLVWKPGVTAWDFLSPLTATAGFRLFCDEHRVWRMIDPATYEVPGFVNLSTFNTVSASDTISREDPEVFATGVLLRYGWQDAFGNAQIAYDAAGTPEKVVVIDYARPFPGPGAAAAILARRSGTGRTQNVDALTLWDTTPGNDASISLPDAPEQQGKVSSVRFSLSDDAVMSIGTRGLIDIPPGSWLDTNPDVSWNDVTPDVTWISLPA